MLHSDNISKALIIGYGSIGKRHADILTELGLDVAILSSRTFDLGNSFTSFNEAGGFNPDYIVVASSTENHISDLKKIQKHLCPKIILVEKPVFSNVTDRNIKKDDNIFVGYNLRFHPLILRLKEELEGQKILSAHIYVGQYLPDWRPDRNHLETYSAIKNRGGGVLRDLSHEIDLCQYLFGGNKKFQAIGGRYGDITVDSDDVYCFILSNENCPAISMQMNYLDRVLRREAIINTEDNSYKYDFVNSILEINGSKEEIYTDKNDSYINMHKALMAGNYKNLCTLNEGIDVLDIICKAENMQ